MCLESQTVLRISFLRRPAQIIIIIIININIIITIIIIIYLFSFASLNPGTDKPKLTPSVFAPIKSPASLSLKLGIVSESSFTPCKHRAPIIILCVTNIASRHKW